eukprot:scaffold827_cov369-Prasinococcus_capsulatus_cf.AAC.29
MMSNPTVRPTPSGGHVGRARLQGPTHAPQLRRTLIDAINKLCAAHQVAHRSVPARALKRRGAARRGAHGQREARGWGVSRRARRRLSASVRARAGVACVFASPPLPPRPPRVGRACAARPPTSPSPSLCFAGLQRAAVDRRRKGTGRAREGRGERASERARARAPPRRRAGRERGRKGWCARCARPHKGRRAARRPRAERACAELRQPSETRTERESERARENDSARALGSSGTAGAGHARGRTAVTRSARSGSRRSGRHSNNNNNNKRLRCTRQRQRAPPRRHDMVVRPSRARPRA